ncbi:MAG: ornithine cyclodeaminase family protein [Noviherbaspirillum sp.]
MLAYLDADRLRRTLPYPALISALRAAFQDAIEAPTRHVHTLSEEEGNVLVVMPAWKQGGMMGVKMFTSVPSNPERGLPTLHYVYILYDTGTGVPLALLDAEEMTKRRTGAASALAATFLARPDSATLLVVGTGALAPYMAAAHCAARPIRTVRVWGRDPGKAQAACERIREQLADPGIRVEPAAGLEAAAGEADIITCATTSRAPLLQSAWIRPGTHVDLAGGFKPDMREADDELMARAALFVDTYAGALAEAGDLAQPIAAGRFGPEAIASDLAGLASGRHPGRVDPRQVTVFKSVGAAIEDLCAATLAWSSEPR